MPRSGLYGNLVPGSGGGGTVTPEQIEAAVNKYLTENPVQAGATAEQAAQIEENKNRTLSNYNDLMEFANLQDIIEKSEIPLSMGIIHNATHNPDSPQTSYNTAYSYYLDSDIINVYFDDSAYKILAVYFDSEKVYVTSGTWNETSPCEISIPDSAQYCAIELRKKSNENFDINQISFPYIISSIVENEIKKNKQKIYDIQTELDILNTQKDGLNFQSTNLFGKKSIAIKGIVSRRYKVFEKEDLSELPINSLIYDGYNFKVILNFEYTYNNHIYCSPDGTGSGLEQESPTTLINAVELSKLNPYSCIHLQNGNYVIPSQIDLTDNSVKMICDKGKAVLIADSEKRLLTENENGTFSAIFNDSLSKIFEKLDDEYLMLVKVDTEEECVNTYGTYFLNQDVIIINKYKKTDDIYITSKIGTPLIYSGISSTLKYNNQSFENIDFIGGASCVKLNDQGVHMFRNCSMIGSYDYGNNGLSVLADAKVICIECISKYSTSDGFNYHRNSRFVEIDCISGSHGYDEESRANSNATTSHETVKGIRIGGVYYDCNGPVVADVGNALTINVNCIALESTSESGRGGFVVDTATMYCYNSYTNDTQNGAWVQNDGGIIYSKNCEFDGKNDSTPI